MGSEEEEASAMGSGDEERKRERRRGGGTRARIEAACGGGSVGDLGVDERKRRRARARERHIVAGVLGSGEVFFWLPCVEESRQSWELFSILVCELRLL
jgi:hypothetical protein